MSDLDEATENPNDKSPPGKPQAPEVIVPEDDAGLGNGQRDHHQVGPGGEDELDETAAGGLTDVGGGKPNERKII